MTVMSSVEAWFCRSAPWRLFARRAVVPWALGPATVDGDVLEIGGGSGAMATALLDRNPALRLTMTDLDPAMVDVARTRLGRFGTRATTEVADASHLPFADDSYDTVCSWLMLHHTIEWQAVLAECTRVLRPGGAFVGYDLTDGPLPRAIHRADRSDHLFITPEALEHELRTLGYGTISVRPAAAGLLMRFTATATATTGAKRAAPALTRYELVPAPRLA